MRVNIPGKHSEFVKNTPSTLPDASKRVICPLCLYNSEEIPMVYNATDHYWACNNCKYILPRHLDPVESSVITAGNADDVMEPYLKTVDFRKTLHNKTRPDTYKTPMEAWKDDVL